MSKSQLENGYISRQIRNAFDFMQKLYNESAFLVKEIEGQLAKSRYRFIILKPSGYGISTRNSTGLDPNSLRFWLLRKFSVAFVEEIYTNIKNGKTHTEITDELKFLYFKFVLNDLNDPKHCEPNLIFGVFYNLKPLNAKKVEKLMGPFEYRDEKIFANLPKISWKDRDVELRGHFEKIPLLSINNSRELNKKVIESAIKLYSGIS